MGEEEGLPPSLTLSILKGPFSACFPSFQPNKEPLADLIHTQGPVSGPLRQGEHNQSNPVSRTGLPPLSLLE